MFFTHKGIDKKLKKDTIIRLTEETSILKKALTQIEDFPNEDIEETILKLYALLDEFEDINKQLYIEKEKYEKLNSDVKNMYNFMYSSIYKNKWKRMKFLIKILRL